MENKEKEDLLTKALEALDDYLNAGCKMSRKMASKKAKIVYEDYYKVKYINKDKRK